jgi:hypothetical protein
MTGAGLHLKTAGTSGRKKVVGLALSGGEGAGVRQVIWGLALDRREELAKPYATVMTRRSGPVPSAPSLGLGRSAFRSGAAATIACPHFNRIFAALHVAFRLAAEGPVCDATLRFSTRTARIVAHESHHQSSRSQHPEDLPACRIKKNKRMHEHKVRWAFWARERDRQGVADGVIGSRRRGKKSSPSGSRTQDMGTPLRRLWGAARAWQLRGAACDPEVDAVYVARRTRPSPRWASRRPRRATPCLEGSRWRSKPILRRR